MLLFLFYGSVGAALAQRTVWSFEDNPDPYYEELSAAEREFLFGEKNPEIERSYIEQGACRVYLAQNYKVYQKRYPDFEQTGSLEENFTNWKMHVSKRPGYISCLASVVWEDLSEMDFVNSFVDFRFCGKYSRPSISAEEYRVQKMIDELFAYTKYGSEPPIFFFLAANKDTKIIDLNPDVEYYIASLEFAQRVEETPERDVDHLEAVLDEERRTFIELAAKNYDLQAILDTTGPCIAE